MPSPQISVMMPVHNAAAYLDESIQSILNQSLKEFEFIILDDASTDGSLEIIQKYAKRDDRIRLFHNASNQKEALSNNFLMDKARTSFGAWMHADDISFPSRLRTQYDYLQAHPDIDILGGGLAAVYSYRWPNTAFVRSNAFNDHQIKSLLIEAPVLQQCFAMFRFEKIKRHNICFRPDYEFAIDYQFFTECAPHCRMAVIEPLMGIYRRHADTSTRRLLFQQRTTHFAITKDYLERLGTKIPSDLVDKLVSLLGAWNFPEHLSSTPENAQRFADTALRQLASAAECFGYPGIDRDLPATLLLLLARDLALAEKNLPAAESLLDNWMNELNVSDCAPLTMENLYCHIYRPLGAKGKRRFAEKYGRASLERSSAVDPHYSGAKFIGGTFHPALEWRYIRLFIKKKRQSWADFEANDIIDASTGLVRDSFLRRFKIVNLLFFIKEQGWFFAMKGLLRFAATKMKAVAKRFQ